MTIKLHNLSGKYHGDRLTLANTLLATYEIASGTYAFDSAEQTFSLEEGSGHPYKIASKSLYKEVDSSATDIDAEMITVDVLEQNSIIARSTADYLFIKTGIADNTINIHKYTDFFTEKNNNTKDTIRLYNDGQEVNSAVTTAIFGGSRSSIVHADIPLGTGDVKGVSLEISTTNEAQIHDLKMSTVDPNIGGDI